MSKNIVSMIFGSHLYGLDTPTSDKDFKGVYIQDLQDILLNGPISHRNNSTKIGQGKNASNDIDQEEYSLGRFVELSARGEMIGIDMLWASKECILQDSRGWNMLVQNRHLFLTKDMRAYMGYIKRQVHKYGVKGSRINAFEKVLAVLKQEDEEFLKMIRIQELYERLPVDSEFLFFKDIEAANGKIERAYEVMGALYMPRSWAIELLVSIEKKHAEYGKRAKQAATNEGVDWKAVSHGLRACWQMKDLLEHGEIVFPFTGARREYLLEVKTGQKDFNEVRPVLEDFYSEVLEMTSKSSLPESVDQKKINDLILTIYEDSFKLYELSEFSC